MQDIRRVTVVGGGLIGASRCALFLVHGLEVVLHDVVPDAEARVREELQRISPVLQSLGLVLDPQARRLSVSLVGVVSAEDLDVAVEKAYGERPVADLAMARDRQQNAVLGALSASRNTFEDGKA
jgi:3-hydroxyacyl-CoA dehydrogenase